MTETFRYPTQWGTELLADGRARFRLWAPAQPRLSLQPRSGAALPMEARDDGWFEVVTDAVEVGGGYGFRLADGRLVPDPAARAQVDDVNGPSRLVDPNAHLWRTPSWRGRPWEEAVIYELHTGTFTPVGTFDGIRSRLDHLVETGVTAVELMPVAQFGGRRGWGYDGTLLYAPHSAYGGPEDLKRLVDEAHERNLMVLLDVVYNHFGPVGNYLPLYAPDFFHPERHTPWGAAIAFEKPAVRTYFIDNALYWLEEYRFDGLRFDAIDHLDHQSDEPILEEIAQAVRGRITDRHVHLTTEDDRNITRLHERGEEGRVRLYTAEWNDDFHHVAHVAATGDAEGYYRDYTIGTTAKLARALAEGYVYQGEPSALRGGAPRGAPSRHLPPTAFVNFLQNHDQIGNRPFGDRLTDLASSRTVATLTTILLLSPQIPLLFMGEEWGETGTFSFFTDFDAELAEKVREGRRTEFRRWPAFSDPRARAQVPDPNAESTFLASKLDWNALHRPTRRARHALVKRLLDIRRREISPRLAGMAGGGVAEPGQGGALVVRWRLGDGSGLALYANIDDEPWSIEPPQEDELLFESAEGLEERLKAGNLPGWSAVFYRNSGGGRLETKPE